MKSEQENKEILDAMAALGDAMNNKEVSHASRVAWFSDGAVVRTDKNGMAYKVDNEQNGETLWNSKR